MAIPKFNKRGLLDVGLHPCTAKEFIKRFCYGKDSIRKKYKEVLEQLFAFSVKRGVSSIIIAGSFVTDKKEPNDLDCIIIFPNEKNIPMQTDELLIVEGCELDIMFVSETNKELIYTLINMFARNRYEMSVGMVEVILDEERDGSTWDDYEEYNSIEKLLEARKAYINRKVVRGVAKKKVLITICNIEDYIYWNNEIAHIVSSSGWIFAPFVYRSKEIFVFIEHFKLWIKKISYTYETDICVFADGLGTYLLGKFFNDDREYRGVSFDKIILSKALLSPTFDWENQFNYNNVNLVINLKDSNATNIRNEKIIKSVKTDVIYGDACEQGFNNKNDKLIEYIYTYNDEIGVDEFKHKILPMFHISEALFENSSREVLNNMHEILKKEISMTDIIK